MTGGVLEPVEPPVEKPEEPTTPPSTEDLLKIKINDEIMAVVGTNDWRAIAYGNGRYIAVGLDGYTAYSTDGENWTIKTVGADSWYGIAFGNGKFVIVGKSRKITTTTDGKTWTTVKQVGTNSVGNWRAIVYADGKFVTSSSEGYAAVSIDGTNWTITQVAKDYTWALDAMTYGNGRFIVTGLSRTYASIDGEAWTQLGDFNPSAFNAIAYGNNKYVAVGVEEIFYSADCESWNRIKISNGAYQWLGIIYAKGLFIACGQSGYIITSTDGESWDKPIQIIEGSGNTNALRGIVAMP